MSSRPKLNHALANTNQQYSLLFEMNGRTSSIMDIYHSLLENQLQNISLSSQCSVPYPSPIIQPPLQISLQPQNFNLVSGKPVYY